MIPGTRYRVVRRLALRARGAVYQVEHLELGRRFVLELLAAELTQSPELWQRTRAEWQALSQVRHPNIVRVTDAGVTARGLAFCVMEQLRGETLGQLLRRRRSLAVPEALRIARELAAALSTAHALGVVHRNVQPDQVFLVTGGAARLLGFGPAVAQGASADRRSDVYGVGLVLFEMVAGKPSHAAWRRRRGCAGEGQAGPPQLARVVPGVSQELSELVAGLLAHDPAARPSLGEAIRQISRLELRYQGQVSTTQETVHYATRRLPFLVETPGAPSASEVIVPLASQTLAGIPWTVIDAREGAVAADEPTRLGGESARPVALPAAAAGDDLLRKPDAVARPPGPRTPSGPRRLPPRRLGWGLPLRLVLVIGCSLLAGVLVASLARRSLAGEASAAVGAAETAGAGR